MSDFLAAALQLTSTSDIDANLNAAEEQIELAAKRGADLVGLPENFAFLGEDHKKLKIAFGLSISILAGASMPSAIVLSDILAFSG